MNVQDIIQYKIYHNYKFKTSQYIKEALVLVKNNYLKLVGFILLSFLISLVVSLVPLIGSFVNVFFISPALTAGYYNFFHNADRNNGKPKFITFFESFKYVGELALLNLTLLIFGMLFLFSFVYFTFDIKSLVQTVQMGGMPTESAAFLRGFNLEKIAYYFIGLFMVGIYMLISYLITTPFIVLSGDDFWTAMENSRKLVAKRFFTFLLIFFVFIFTVVALITIFIYPLVSNLPAVDISSYLVGEKLKFTIAVSIILLIILMTLGFFIHAFLYSVYKDLVSSVEEEYEEI